MKALPPLRSASAALALTLALSPAASPAPPASGHNATTPQELQLEWAAPLDGLHGAEPSGLCLVNGALLTVSDKHDRAIYRIEISPPDGPHSPLGRGRLIPHLVFDPPPRQPPGRADFEAITFHPGDNAFYLASERFSDLLRVDAATAEARWISLSLPPAGRAPRPPGGPPFLAKPNAGIEGIAFLPKPSRLLLAAEREPRGLIALPWPPRPGAPPLWREMARSTAPLADGRLPDYSDLAVFNSRLFALSRNAEAVVQLRQDRAARSWTETRAWSFAATARDPRFAYAHNRFGMAEGLAITHDAVWIILDNNRSWRASAPADRRPLLFRFARPSDMR